MPITIHIVLWVLDFVCVFVVVAFLADKTDTSSTLGAQCHWVYSCVLIHVSALLHTVALTSREEHTCKPAQTTLPPWPVNHTHKHLFIPRSAVGDGRLKKELMCLCGWTDKWTAGGHRWMAGRPEPFPLWLPGIIDQPFPSCCIFNCLARKQIRRGCGALGAQRWSPAVITQGPHQRPSIAAEDTGTKSWDKKKNCPVTVCLKWFTLVWFA